MTKFYFVSNSCKKLLVLFLILNLGIVEFAYSQQNRVFYSQTLPSMPSIGSSNYNKTYKNDANGDGIIDILYTTSSSMGVLIFDTSGSFTNTTIAAGSTYPAYSYGSRVVDDFNNDGKPDFAWYNFSTNDIIISYWSANNSTGIPQYTTPARVNSGMTAFTAYGVYGLNSGDIDGDGDKDLLVFGPNGIYKPQMLINNGNNSFTSYDLHNQAAYQSFSQIMDWNNDGKVDVLVSVNGGIDLYLNNGNNGIALSPTFTKYTLINSTVGDGFDSNGGQFEVADFNNDGKNDIILNHIKCIYNGTCSWTAKTRIIINTTSASTPTNYSFVASELVNRPGNSPDFESLGGYGAIYEDVNNDGIKDIVGNRNGNTVDGLKNLSVVKLAFNSNTNIVSILEEKQIIDYGPLTQTLALGYNLINHDYNGDGENEIVLSYSGSPNMIYYKSYFPSYSQTGLTALSLNNQIFIGGKASDEITFNLSSSSSGSFAVSGANGGTVSGSGSGTIAITGTVNKINNSLQTISYTPSVSGIHKLEVKVINNANEISSKNLILNVGPLLPVITSFNPLVGSVGTTVTISGTNLSSVTSVEFGGVASSSFTVVNASTISAIAPLGAKSGAIKLGYGINSKTTIATVAASNTGSGSYAGWSNAWQKITNGTASKSLTKMSLNLSNTSSSTYNLYLEVHKNDLSPSNANPYNKFDSSTLAGTSQVLSIGANTGLGLKDFIFDGSIILPANSNYYIVLKESAGNPNGDGGQTIQFGTPTLSNGGAGNNLGTLNYSFESSPYFSMLPSITKTGTLTTFTKCSGSPSLDQTINISGSDLISDITISALAGYEYSLNDMAYFPSLTIPFGSGTILSTPIHIRLTNTVTGAPTGTISISSTSAVTKTISVNGTSNDLPSISVQPSNIAHTYCQNSTANTLTVVALGTGVSYQWYKNTTESTAASILIAGAITDSYTPSTTVPSALYYYCVISGTCNPSVTSNFSGLISVDPTSVSGTITTSSICIGNSATLNLSGYTGLIQWQEFENPIWSDITGETNSSFTTPALSTSTTYRATVLSGSCSVVSSTDQIIIVNPNPVISGSTSVAKGEIIAFNATTTPANNNVWVSSNPSVATVTSSGVVSGLVLGNATITYTNSNGCSATSAITVTTGTTKTPVLNSPATNTTGATTLRISYTLPEAPLEGSVQLLFTPTTGGNPIVWTMNNSTSANFDHIVGSNPTTISNVVSGAALTYKTYNITLSYQDAYANPAASIINSNIQTLAPPTISLPQTNYTATVNLDSTPFTIQNTGGVTTFSISPDLPNGLALNTVTGEISGRPTVPITNTLFTITASNAVGTATVFFRLFIDLDTDGDGIGNQNDLDIDGDGIPNNSDSDINGDGTIDNGTDMDDDGINDTNDSDIDGDGIVNDADADINGDGTIDNGADIDADGINDANDSDIDGDGISNYKEGYNYTIPGNSLDTDRDGIPDYRDADSDNDTVLDQYDVFPTDKTEYIDSDGDGIGNNADTDDDNDGILDYADIDSDGDNIPDNGIDMDGDGINDANDPDMDGDGISNAFDNCPITPNTNQADRDHDGIGDGCDFTELNVVNAITPNGDGINDAWFIYNIENHPNSIIRVFNINGSEVFYSNDYHNDWDGRYKNFNDTLPLLSSYFYQIDLEGDGTIDNEGWLYITK